MSFNSPSQGHNASSPDVTSVHFDTVGYEAQTEHSSAERLVWFTPEGDGVSITFDLSPPDLPARASTLDELTVFYANLLQTSAGRIVELSVLQPQNYCVVQTLVRLPLHPTSPATGAAYVGALTLPFAGCSYVIKVQCSERGITGMREAILLDLAMGAGLRPGTPQFEGQWNPDDERYDAQFPDHPVSRARRVLKHILGSLEFASPIATLAPFRWPLGTP